MTATPGNSQPAAKPPRTLGHAERTYSSPEPCRTLRDARERQEQLTPRDLTARPVANLKAPGQFYPGTALPPWPPAEADKEYVPPTGRGVTRLATGRDLAAARRASAAPRCALTAPSSTTKRSRLAAPVLCNRRQSQSP